MNRQKWLDMVDRAIDGLNKAKKAIDTALEVLSKVRNNPQSNGNSEVREED
jgi:hypothetical protein